jgi:hypothetical protein
MERFPVEARIAQQAAFLLALALIACTGPTQDRRSLPVTPASDTAGAPVVRRPLPDATPAPPVQPSAAPTLAIAAPPGALYVCVIGAGAELSQTSIEFAPGVGEVCRKHPEMGPCRYERDACRRSGGRVFAADGSEITPHVEDEYDKRVLRIRLHSN